MIQWLVHNSVYISNHKINKH